MLTQIYIALVLAAREGPGRGDDAGQTGDIFIILGIALLVALAIVGWFAWQRRA